MRNIVIRFDERGVKPTRVGLEIARSLVAQSYARRELLMRAYFVKSAPEIGKQASGGGWSEAQTTSNTQLDLGWSLVAPLCVKLPIEQF